jgi:ribosomal protein S18 acetylase RimI-like enzyme
MTSGAGGRDHAADPECVDLTLEQVYSLPPIPSGYTTSVVYVLRRSLRPPEFVWMLVLADTEPFTKVYDAGDPKDWLEPYFAEVRGESTRFIGASLHGHTAGLLTYAETTWNNTLWLVDIRVRDDARRGGVGTALLEALKQRAHQEGVRGISVETQINNVPAINFYRKHGFEISGFNDHYYENDDLERQDVALFLFWESPSRF